MNNELTPAQFNGLINFYTDPNGINGYYFTTYQTSDNLEKNGWIESAGIHERGYKLTDKGHAYIDDFKTRVENRDLTGMDANQRAWVIARILDPHDPADKNMLNDLAETDRSEKNRTDALQRLIDADALTQDEWNRMAHSDDKNHRIEAINHVDINEYRDETNPDVTRKIINKSKENLPHDIIMAWYRNGNIAAVKAMDEKDIDMVLEDGNPMFVEEVVYAKAGKLTAGQVRRIIELVESEDENGFTNPEHIVRDLLDRAPYLPETFIAKHADDWLIVYRLREYREAYRLLKQRETMFADPDGEFVREQQRLALTED